MLGRAAALTVLACQILLMCKHNATSVILIPMSDFVSHVELRKYASLHKIPLSPDAKVALWFTFASRTAGKISNYRRIHGRYMAVDWRMPNGEREGV